MTQNKMGAKTSQVTRVIMSPNKSTRKCMPH